MDQYIILVRIICVNHNYEDNYVSCYNLKQILDMQKFPLRMKDNDLLVTELYRDPSNDPITAISVYLTPKTSKFLNKLLINKIVLLFNWSAKSNKVCSGFNC